MEKDRYVAYVGTYTHENSLGIHIYDLDVENGSISERKMVPYPSGRRFGSHE